MPLLIIYNPQAGNGRARSLLPEVKNYLKAKQIKAEILLTNSSGHATDIVAKTKLHKYSAVIASGGDGTLFEVVNGYFKNKQDNKPPIGLIPNGTGNAFMKELGLQKSDWRKAIDIIVEKNSQLIDVAKFTCELEERYFINMLGMGFVTQVAEASIPIKWLGNAAYTIATLFKLINLRAQQYEIEVDGQVLLREGVFVEVGNSRYTGTKFLMAPKAKLYDGLLDVVILNKISRLRLLRLFTSIYDGSHVQYPEVEYIQAKKIKVIEQYPKALIPDGELMGHTPVSIECMPKALSFLWPV